MPKELGQNLLRCVLDPGGGGGETSTWTVLPRLKWTREILKALLENHHKTGTISPVKDPFVTSECSTNREGSSFVVVFQRCL